MLVDVYPLVTASLSRSRRFASRSAPTPVRSSRASSLRVNWNLSSTRASTTNVFSTDHIALAGRQIPWTLSIHHASLEIEVDPLVSSASTRPRTVARSLWWEGVSTLDLVTTPLGAASFFFLFRTGLNPHPSSVSDGVGGQNLPSVIRNVRYRKMTSATVSRTDHHGHPKT